VPQGDLPEVTVSHDRPLPNLSWVTWNFFGDPFLYSYVGGTSVQWGDPRDRVRGLCTYSIANNPKAGRNIFAGAIAGAGVLGTLYTAIAVVNLEDGAGEVMLALRAAQLASNSEATIFVSESLEAVASASGKVDAAIAAANGGGVGFGLGAGAGLALSSSGCQ
jgi:hypothetical protein